MQIEAINSKIPYVRTEINKKQQSLEWLLKRSETWFLKKKYGARRFFV